mmetsp:Transcript_20908/g.19959  ORF Transcript_20908/g.19959 Transcript_20908/m.19959 type:complete len:203 (+) Transcript_20908:837-1445(+)
MVLTPFLMRQFLIIMRANSQEKSIFSNYRNIVQLLKKSLSSIGIDKKNGIYERLDSLQREAEKNDEKLIRTEFDLLIKASIDLCYQMGFLKIIVDCERILIQMRSCLCIDSALVEVYLKLIKSFFLHNEVKKEDFKDDEYASVNEKVYSGEIFGEETSQVKKELRPIYFGLKNIILKEIENIDKDIDVKKFFIEPPNKNEDN